MAPMTDSTFTIRKAEDRGHARHGGWLDSRHTFSFANYYDPAHMGFGPLRVINDDRVAPGEGFGRHPHRDMEILSYVVEGSLEHRDSLGTGSVIRPGDVQRMTAGTGVAHSEFNGSKSDPVRFLQIWVIPERAGLQPGYEQKHFGDERRGGLRLVASRDGREGSVTIHQDLDLHATVLAPGEAVTHTLAAGRQAWVQVEKGSVVLNERPLAEGDGAALRGVPTLELRATADAEFLVFDMFTPTPEHA